VKRTRSAALTAAAAVAVAVVPAATALADQTPVLLEQHGSHQVWYSAGEPYDVQDKTTYWDLVSLDGMCGFTRPTLELSDMRETFFVQQHQNGAKAGFSTTEAKLLDETFALTEYAPDGSAARVYRGLGDEYAQAADTPDGTPTRVNLRVVFRGSSDDGRHLDVVLKMRLRTDATTGDFSRFDASVQSCHVS
jgi:hypothetical protein